MVEAQRYSWISTVNHWITALLVTVMLVLGFGMAAAPGEAEEAWLMTMHQSIGFLTLLFVLWRAGYRLYEGFPPTLGESEWQRRAAYWAHRIILTLLVLQVLTGPLYLFTEAEGVNVFGWFTFYLPLGALGFLHEPAEVLHVYMGLYVLPALLVLHFIGAVRHFMARDRHETPADM